jgi:Centromere DNA-binding protein complex CBF3 subunit, domain 2
VHGFDSARSKVFSTLRNQYIYFRTLGTLLRGESLFKEELSDHFLVEHHAQKDPHPAMEIAISQVATGKTNKNYKLFGRLCCHKYVCMCGFGALGFYLLYRFECTGEFEKSTVDFTKAEEWFDIKMLVSLHNFQESQFKGIKDTMYAEYVKSILTVLGLPTSSQLHLGCCTL